MIEKILVPTDGSPLSACALPMAIELGEAQAARIVLAQVVHYFDWMMLGPSTAYLSPDVCQRMMDDEDEAARQNLKVLAAKAQSRRVAVEAQLLHGHPAAELLDFEATLRPDLVVMSTHGRTGLARFARGSVADLVLREGTAPVLLVRAFEPPTPSFETVLVPLDGSRLAEVVLPMLRELAGKPVKQLQLCRAVASPDDRPDALAYLERIAAALREFGFDVFVEAEVGLPFDAIASAARAADIVVMATHGRGGFDRFRHGSIAERALGELTKPVLLVRAGLPQQTHPTFAEARSDGHT